MSSIYTHRMTCIIPAPLGVIGAAVARAIDTDTGGAESFVPMDAEYGAEGNITKPPTKLWVSNCPVIERFAQAIPYLLSDPAALLATIELDLSLRFPEVVPPTLAEVQAFCAAASAEVVCVS